MKVEAGAAQRLLLAGGGHSHALLLRAWAMGRWRLPAHTAVTLVSRCSTTLYSGMVPALIAGVAAYPDCTIDLRRLCTAAGVSFVQGEIEAVDVTNRRLQLAAAAGVRREGLGWDWLSLDVGSVTAVPAGLDGIAVKPLEPFLAWCETLPPVVEVVGSGASAVEVALALAARCERQQQRCRLSLRTAPDGLRLGHGGLHRRMERLLADRGVALRRVACGMPVTQQVTAVFCTGSAAPPWLRGSGLPCNHRGRVITGDDLTVRGQRRIFAVGDCGVLAAAERPASGVWAVRVAPTLARNLQAALRGGRLQRWRPQARALLLLGDGRGEAMAQWGRLWAGPGPLLWQLKQRIDRRFMASLGDDLTMGQAPAQQASSRAMVCRGCAAKLPASVLGGALEQLHQGHRPMARDASRITVPGSREVLLQSLDGFPALVDDPWLNGRLTVLHAASDLWASGACVEGAQALVTLPRCSEALQQELLLQCLAGVRGALNELGAELLGGHSLQALVEPDPLLPLPVQLSLGLSVHGRCAHNARWRKGPLQPGDVLVLSRPLGSGVIMAAARAGASRAEWVDGALATMGCSQQPLVALLRRHGCHACTDITGFGLLGHMGEMLADSGADISVVLKARALPAFAGAPDLLRDGWQSTFAVHNADFLKLLAPAGPVQLTNSNERGDDRAIQGLLVDPQTCGPLLAAVPGRQADALLQAMAEQGFTAAAVVGWVKRSPSPGFPCP